MTRPREAQLIYEARTNMGLSFRQAAAIASQYKKMTEGSWRRTESDKRLTRTPDTVAAMAAAVGVTPPQLQRAGRQDAAAVLETMLAEPPDNGGQGNSGDFEGLAAEVASMRAEVRRLAEALERRDTVSGTEDRARATG